ncbi:unnamed protein product [Trichogramma brassicae]|uniref:Uncharacterized protein n=1 Tax=Trichogramma brassicae TaxID=86971 RepID=A0A6H5J470_9HYME|nr:unnamed protein product [Trichogramma brassicae]
MQAGLKHDISCSRRARTIQPRSASRRTTLVQSFICDRAGKSNCDQAPPGPRVLTHPRIRATGSGTRRRPSEQDSLAKQDNAAQASGEELIRGVSSASGIGSFNSSNDLPLNCTYTNRKVKGNWRTIFGVQFYQPEKQNWPLLYSRTRCTLTPKHVTRHTTTTTTKPHSMYLQRVRLVVGAANQAPDSSDVIKCTQRLGCSSAHQFVNDKVRETRVEYNSEQQQQRRDRAVAWCVRRVRDTSSRVGEANNVATFVCGARAAATLVSLSMHDEVYCRHRPRPVQRQRLQYIPPHRAAASLRIIVTGRAESTEGEKEKGYTYRAAGARRRCSDRPSLLARLSILRPRNAPTSRRVCIMPCGRAPGRSALTHASTRLSSAYTPPGTSTCLCVHRAIGRSDRNDMSNNNDNAGSVASAASNNNIGGGLQLLKRPWCFRERDWLTSPPPKKKWIRHYLLGEEPIDGQPRPNGVYYHQPVQHVHAQQQHQLTQNVGGRSATINQSRIIVGSPISTVATVHGREIHSDVVQLQQQQQPHAVQQQHQQSSSAQFNPHLENHNSNHSVSSVSGPAPAPANEVDQQASTSQTNTGGEHRRTRNGDDERVQGANTSCCSSVRELTHVLIWPVNLIVNFSLSVSPLANAENQEAEGGNSNSGLARAGTRYSSTSSLSSAATDNSHSAQQQQQQQQQQQPSNGNANGSSSQMAATAVVFSQTQNVNLGQGIRESPPTISSPNATTATQPTPAQEKVTIATSVVQAQTVAASQITSATPTQLHLPISAQMINASSGLTFVPALQQLGSSLRVIPSDGRQLIAVQSNGPNSGVSGTTGEPRPVALVVHSTTANNDNRVTLVHSTSNDVRPVTFVSGSVLTAAHAPISVTKERCFHNEFVSFSDSARLPHYV